VYFLGDFKEQIKGISANYYGMLDQLIASRGNVFVGAFFSTFTGYINRMRGYHAQKDKLPGYEEGILESYYYVPDHMAPWRNVMRQYGAVQPAFWQQEFHVSWRDLDHDVTLDKDA
jgi:GDP-fucose protein O-fucosyltransferase